jgi:dTDP-glucose 4,6-dehydratase/UDP-glucuronate decarboxylase
LNNIKTSLINVVGVESLLSYMLSTGGGKLLFLSTSEIYGNPPEHMLPTPESYGGTYTLDNNREAYKVSKKMGEVICKEYNKDPSMQVRVARVALSYGPGALLGDQRVLQEFIFKAHQYGKIEMLDDGAAIRNYLYITDSIEYLLNILLYGRELVYNVGGDSEPITICALAQKIATNFEATVKKGPSKSDTTKSAPKNVGLDMNRYKTEFQQETHSIINLEKGISTTIEWFNFDRAEQWQ